MSSINLVQNFLRSDIAATVLFKSQVYISRDSVGQAKILAKATSVRITFSKPYQQQPIVTVTPNSRVGGEYWVADKDATGFTIYIDRSYMSNTTNTTYEDITFDWHVFASPEAKLTVSDGTTTDVVLVIPPPPVVEVITGSVSGASTGGSDTASDPTPTPPTDSIEAEPEPTSEGTNEETPPPDTTPTSEPIPPSPDTTPASEGSSTVVENSTLPEASNNIENPTP